MLRRTSTTAPFPPSIARGVLIAALMCVAACSRDAEPAPATAGGSAAPSAAAPALEDGAPPVQEASTAPAVAAPAAAAPARPVPTQPAAARPAVASAGADMKELERNPGATPPPAAVIVAAGPAHKTMAGKPGPSPAFGKDTAPVRILLFSDFQCPVCRRVVEPAKALARAYPEDVQIIWKHNALEMHRSAEGAALASIAAFRQGKFWEFHDELFKNQRALSAADLRGTAQRLGLDMARYDKDLVDPDAKAQVEYERNVAAALGARGTPGMFFNGKKQVGWGSYSGFKAMALRALKDAQALAGTGVPAAQVAVKATAANGEDGAKVAELLWGATK